MEENSNNVMCPQYVMCISFEIFVYFADQKKPLWLTLLKKIKNFVFYLRLSLQYNFYWKSIKFGLQKNQ